jgi:integrase
METKLTQHVVEAADRRLFLGPNPTEGIRIFREEKRERFLSPDELRRVNEALAEEPNEFWWVYFPLSLLLGTRRSELLSALWADIDLDQCIWRLPMTKAGHSHLLPLPSPAVEILRTLPSRGKSKWVFPGIGATGHLVEQRRLGSESVNVPTFLMFESMTCAGRWEAGFPGNGIISN